MAISLCVLPLATGGCSVRQDAESRTGPATTSVEMALDADWHRLAAHGYVYFQANTDGARHYELFRTNLTTGTTDQLTDLPGPFGISNFSVSPSGVVVADASSLIDQAAMLRPDGSLARLPGPRALGPSINEHGDVLATIERGTHDVLAVLPRGASRWRPIATISGWTVSRWYDDRTAVLLRIGKDQTTWRKVDVEGTASRWRALGPDLHPSSIVTRDGQPVLLAGAGSGFLWTPGTGRLRRLPQGWRSGCISPDGKRILLTRRGVLATIDIDDLSGKVREIGTLPGDILGCGWAEEKHGP